MKLNTDLKQDIQCFVYFLFRGHLDPRLINVEFDYLDLLLNNPKLLYNCFEIFAFDYQTKGKHRNPEIRKEIFIIEGEKLEKTYENRLEVDYIIALNSEKELEAEKIRKKAFGFNSIQNNFWNDFLKLSWQFCFEFVSKIDSFNLVDLYNCGTDAVPAFAAWTNVVEINEISKVLNSEFALKRA
jgi:hypothetical protein